MSAADLEFFATLAPATWKWIGRQALLRGKFGVFQLEAWSGGTHGHLAGLEGRFTSFEGAQTTIEFRFADLLTCKPSDNQHCPKTPHAWTHRNGVEWYIGTPATLAPLFNAITAWVRMWDQR